MLDLTFKGHTTEKLDIINYYYGPWFKIVGSIRGQKAYIIDCYAGTGYSIIDDEKKLGSALLATKLFKNDFKKNLVLHLIQKNFTEYQTLFQNVRDFTISKGIKHNATIGDNIYLHRKDWSKIINHILNETQGGIRFFLLDTDDIKSLSWQKIFPLIQLGRDDFGYKISGNELLINYPWFGIRRQLGDYYSEQLDPNRTTLNRKALDSFFPFNWRYIAKKYPPSIFRSRDAEKIKKLSEELLIAYVLKIFEYFRYVSIHSVRHRVKSEMKDILKPGENYYYLIFASNHPKAPEIINRKFDEYINKCFYSKTQTNLSKFINEEKRELIQKTPTINEKLRSISINLTKNEKNIIKYLYNRKNHDFGCFEYFLLRELNIVKNDRGLANLIKKNIIDQIDRHSKKGNLMKFYRLIYPNLVNRNDYLYFDNRIFLHNDGKLDLKQNGTIK